MITGAAQQQLQTSPAAISAAKQSNSGQSSPLSGVRDDATAANSVAVNFETSRSLAGIAKEYDVRNMSPRGMAAMSQKLYQSGAISFQDHALLSFQPELSPEFSKTPLGHHGKPDGPRDFIAQWEMQLQIHEKRGDIRFSKIDRRMLNILGNLAALRESANA